jgi:hypothetical protein
MRSALAFCRRRKLVCAVGGGEALRSIAAFGFCSDNPRRHLWRNLFNFSFLLLTFPYSSLLILLIFN